MLGKPELLGKAIQTPEFDTDFANYGIFPACQAEDL